MTDGIILIDKPSDMTSFGVVARVRRADATSKQKVKVGHTGTLDPFATGLMILVVGKECKNAGMYTKLDKVYEATFTLGQESSTEIQRESLRLSQTRCRHGRMWRLYSLNSQEKSVSDRQSLVPSR